MTRSISSDVAKKISGFVRIVYVADDEVQDFIETGWELVEPEKDWNLMCLDIQLRSSNAED